MRWFSSLSNQRPDQKELLICKKNVPIKYQRNFLDLNIAIECGPLNITSLIRKIIFPSS